MRSRSRFFSGVRRAAVAACAAVALLAPAAPCADGPEVLLSKVEALRLVFPRCDRVLEVRRLLDDEEKRALEKTLHRALEERGFLVYVGLRGAAVDGFAGITNEIGKTEPITFIVGAERAGDDGRLRVRRVAVMVYRESRGGEVRSKRFLEQFEGKTRDDALELHRDVVNVSGATLSASALCNGTRKVLAALETCVARGKDDAVVGDARARGAKEIALAAADGGDAPAAASGSGPVEARRLVMGSELRVVALPGEGTDRRALARSVQHALDAAERLDAVLSDWKEESELSRVNRDALHGPVAVGPELLDFLQQSAALSAATANAFDPTIGALVRKWGFRGGAPREPSAAELASACADCGMAGVAIDASARTVAFTRPGVVLDPGAIGKGMAVDAVAAALRADGVTNAFVDFRSSQIGFGPGPEGSGWPIAVADPFAAGATVERFFLRDTACSTSGASEKFVEIGGRRFGHILDPATGRPAEASASATVIASTGARSDALATALFVLGPARGPAVIDAIPDAAGLLVPAADGGRPAALRTRRWPATAAHAPLPGTGR
jgi:thiamine biosynthesis lipoprotein